VTQVRKGSIDRLQDVSSHAEETGKTGSRAGSDTSSTASEAGGGWLGYDRGGADSGGVHWWCGASWDSDVRVHWGGSSGGLRSSCGGNWVAVNASTWARNGDRDTNSGGVGEGGTTWVGDGTLGWAVGDEIGLGLGDPDDGVVTVGGNSGHKGSSEDSLDELHLEVGVWY